MSSNLPSNDASVPSAPVTQCHCEMSSVQIIEVIHLKFIRGLRALDDPCRYVQQWWTKEGRMIAENDPFDSIYDARETVRADAP